MIIKTKLLPPGAIAYTVAPFIFVRRGEVLPPKVLLHESVHLRQQMRWGVVGAVLGLLVWAVMGWPPQLVTVLLAVTGLLEGWVTAQLLWRFCYLAVLPAGWNPFRRKWETEAMLAEGRTLDEIEAALRKAPYYLWC